jgi:hypothetical protein
VPPHPAQPPDRYTLPVQRGPDQIPELAGERASAAVHVFEYRPEAALSGRAEDREAQLPNRYQPTASALAAWQ